MSIWALGAAWGVKRLSDDELYRRYLAGDSPAFDALIAKYSGRLVLYLEGLTRDVRDAEDLAIESFAAILAKRPAIRPGGFQAYLYRTARNRATRFHMLRRRLPAFGLEEAQLWEAQTARPEDEFLKDERRRAVQRCLASIEPEPREALWLVYFEEMSYVQAASVLGVNAKRIDNLLVRGKRLMRAELAKEGITDARE